MIHKNWAELIKPAQLEVKPGNDQLRQATMIVNHLKEVWSNSWQCTSSVLMSSLQAAITSVQIDNVLHEFSSITGVERRY